MLLHGKQYYKKPPFEVLDKIDIDELPQPVQKVFYEVLDSMYSQNHNAEELIHICTTYQHYPSFVALHTDIIIENEGIDAAIEILEEGLSRMPDALLLKFTLGRFYWELSYFDKFEELMVDWLDIRQLRVHRPLNVTEFRQLTSFYIDYYDLDYETTLILEVYSWTLEEKYIDLAYDLSVAIVQKTIASDELEEELSEFDEDNMSEGLDLELDESVSLDYFDNLELNEKPYYPIFEEILKHEDYMFIEEEQIAMLDQLPANKEVSHDVQWVIKETLLGAYRNDTYEFEPILAAVLVAGSKKLVDCLPTILEIYKVSFDTGEYIYDDDEMHIVGASIGYMINDHWPMIREWLMNSDINWYHKSTFFKVIATQMKLGTSEIDISEIKKLGAFYYPEYTEELNWLCYSFAEVNFIELKEYFEQEKFVEIYDDQIIDLNRFDQNSFSNDLVFDFTLKEKFATLASMYTERTELMRAFMEEENEEESLDELHQVQTENNEILEIVNLNAIEALQLMDQDAESNSEYQEPIVNLGPKIGRNDACPCGSGKKYKKCCLNLN